MSTALAVAAILMTGLPGAHRGRGGGDTSAAAARACNAAPLNPSDPVLLRAAVDTLHDVRDDLTAGDQAAATSALGYFRTYMDAADTRPGAPCAA